MVSQQILEAVRCCVTSGLSKLVANLLDSLKLQAYSPPLPIESDRIHVANGTYFMDGHFSPEKTYCNNWLAPLSANQLSSELSQNAMLHKEPTNTIPAVNEFEDLWESGCWQGHLDKAYGRNRFPLYVLYGMYGSLALLLWYEDIGS